MSVLSTEPPFNVFNLRTWLKDLNENIDTSYTTTPQSANTVFAGPTSGIPAIPSFRALVANDIPNISASKITSGVFDNAQVNWASPNAIGLTTPGVGSFISFEQSSVLSTSVSDVITDHSIVEFTGTTAGQTITLPLISSRGSTMIFIKNRSTQTVTISRAGSEVITNAGAVGTVTSFTMATGVQLILVAVSSVSTWYVFD